MDTSVKVYFKHKVDFGFGRKAIIKRVNSAEMIKHYGEDVAGCWDSKIQTIYINKSLSMQRQIKAYWHELHHALVDLQLDDEGGV